MVPCCWHKQGAAFREPLSAAARSAQQHLCAFLGANNARMMALFRDWDGDGNGALDRREFHRAIGCLGYYCDKKEIDSLFDLIDESGDGNIDFGEMKRALNAWSKGSSTASPRSASAGQVRGGNFGGASPEKRRPTSARVAEAVDSAEMVLLGLPEGENAGELTMEAHGTHTHTVVLLHAEGSFAEAHGRLYRRFGEIGVHCKFIFPRAPSRQMPQGHSVTCWMAPKQVTPPATDGSAQGSSTAASVEAARGQLGAQTRRLHALLDREIALLGGDASRVVFGGSSQGGMVAIHASMSYKQPLSALLCLRTMISDEHTSVLGGEHASTPVFVFAGGRDTVCPLSEQRASFQRLSDAGYMVEWHVEPDLSHHGDCLNEQRYVAYWVARASMATGSKGSFGSVAVEALRRSLIVRKPPASPTAPLSPRPGTARSAGRRSAGRSRFSAALAKEGASPGRARSASPERHGSPTVQMLGPVSPGSPSPRHTHGMHMVMGPDGKLQRTHPLLLEPSWRQPRDANAASPKKAEWNDRCCTEGERGLGPALSRKLEQIVAEERILEDKRRVSFVHAQRMYSRPVSARVVVARGSGLDRSPSPPRPGSSPQSADRYLRHNIRDAATGQPLTGID